MTLLARDADRLRAAASSLTGPTHVVECDIRQRKAVDKAFAGAAAALGPIHALVASAGIGGPNEAGSDDRFDDLVATNLIGRYSCVQAALGHLAPGPEREGGVMEAFITSDEVRSPSVQIRASPDGEAEVLSTHEQILGGPNGLCYVGCRMPADPDYAAELAVEGQRVGQFLADKGVIGRFAVDFLATRNGGGWTTYALEINLRNGATTHPYSTLQALTSGSYDIDQRCFVPACGTVKNYKATDHLEREEYARLTTDDFLPRHGLSWNHERQTGVVFHLASALAGMGHRWPHRNRR